MSDSCRTGATMADLIERGERYGIKVSPWTNHCGVRQFTATRMAGKTVSTVTASAPLLALALMIREVEGNAPSARADGEGD